MLEKILSKWAWIATGAVILLIWKKKATSGAPAQTSTRTGLTGAKDPTVTQQQMSGNTMNYIAKLSTSTLRTVVRSASP